MRLHQNIGANLNKSKKNAKNLMDSYTDPELIGVAKAKLYNNGRYDRAKT